MAFDNKEGLVYSFKEDGINQVIDELSPTSYLSLREVRWTPDGEFKLDLRRYFVKPDDTEMPGKGCSIHNPDRLTNVLVNAGFGDSEKLLRDLMYRDDTSESFGTVLADMTDKEYTTFKKELDTARTKAIANRGSTPNEFMEYLA